MSIHTSDTDVAQLDDLMLATVREIAASRTYPAGVLLTHQGASEQTFYVIESGCAVVSRRLEDGTEQVLNTLGARQSFGEMALLDDNPRLASVKTLADTTVLELTADSFRELLQRDPDLALHITRRVLANLRKLDQLAIEDLRAKNALLHEAYVNLQAAQAELVEKERLERELELAAEMQRRLLPADMPAYADFRFAAYLAPARHVGGDLFDVQPLDDEHVGLLLADVADKGMHAALLMAVTRTLFFQEAQRSLSPAAVTQAVHAGLMGIGRSADGPALDAFVTAFYGVLHRPSGRLTYVRAAQERPLLRRAGQTLSPLPGDGRFLGMIEDLTLQEHSVEVQPGDLLLLYSDGVTDAQDAAGQSYGAARLRAAFDKGDALDARAALAVLVADINRWQGGAPAFDDVTMLMMEAVPVQRRGRSV